jgi:hypothetical protein
VRCGGVDYREDSKAETGRNDSSTTATNTTTTQTENIAHLEQRILSK